MGKLLLHDLRGTLFEELLFGVPNRQSKETNAADFALTMPLLAKSYSPSGETG